MRCRLQPENCLLKLNKQSLMHIFVHLEIPCKRFQAVTIVTDLFGIEVRSKKKVAHCDELHFSFPLEMMLDIPFRRKET